MDIHKKSEFYTGGKRGRYKFPKNHLIISRDFPDKYPFLDLAKVNAFFADNRRVKEVVVVLNDEEQEQLLSWGQALARREKWGDMPDAAIDEIESWETQNKSPYSHSYYNADVDWDSKPEGSLRLSDHWHWTDEYGALHCQVAGAGQEGIKRWLLCRYEHGQYVIVREF